VLTRRQYFAFSRWQETGYRDVVTPLFADRSTPPALHRLPFDLRSQLQRAENEIAQHPEGAAAYLQAAELLHFEMYWLEAAAPLYEKFVELQPNRDDIRWRLIDVYLNTTDIDGQERQYLKLLERNPHDPLAHHLYYKWFLPMYSASLDVMKATQKALKALAVIGPRVHDGRALADGYAPWQLRRSRSSHYQTPTVSYSLPGGAV
jgi:tetratricopeptide (TPR) repeat protein